MFLVHSNKLFWFETFSINLIVQIKTISTSSFLLSTYEEQKKKFLKKNFIYKLRKYFSPESILLLFFYCV